jgi:TPR repeat protein
MTFDWLYAKIGLPSNRAVNELQWGRSSTWDWKCARSWDWDALSYDPQKADAIEAAALSENHPSIAFQRWLAAAEKGSGWCMREVGRCYYHGIGVAQDTSRAEEWFRRSFEAGSQLGMLECAKLAHSRDDFAECEAIYSVGAARTWAPALFGLAWSLLKQSKKRETYLRALPLLEGAAALGSPAAKRFLSLYMAKGYFGLLKIPRGLGLLCAETSRLLRVVDQTPTR